MGEGASVAACSIPGCGDPVKGRGLCQRHYKRLMRHGDPLYERPRACSVDGCGEPVHAKGMCQQHYRAAKDHGDPHHRRAPTQSCSVPGCDRPAMAKGMCNSHYKKLMRHGDALFERPTAGPKPRHRRKEDGRPMLSAADILFIQQHPDVPPGELAQRFRTTIRTVIAVKAGRNWGYLG